MTRCATLTNGSPLLNLAAFLRGRRQGSRQRVLRSRCRDSRRSLRPLTALNLGLPGLGTTAFAEPPIDAFRSSPSSVVGGNGLVGITIMAQPEIATVVQLRGLMASTVRRDRLEILLHETRGRPWPRLR